MAGNHKMAQIIWTGNRHFMKVTWFHETDCAPSLAYKIVQALNSFMAGRFVLFSRTPPQSFYSIPTLSERLLSQLSAFLVYKAK